MREYVDRTRNHVEAVFSGRESIIVFSIDVLYGYDQNHEIDLCSGVTSQSRKRNTFEWKPGHLIET